MRAVIHRATRTTERPAQQGTVPASRGCLDPACTADDEVSPIARYTSSPAAPRGPAMRGSHGPPLGQDFSRVSVHARQDAARVSNPHDPDEREADALAARILAPPRAGFGRVTSAAVDPSAIQRRCARCEDEDQARSEGAIQRRGHGDPAVTSAVAAAVGALGQGGEPLPAGERRFFEERLGHELSQVRVHTDRQAADAARALNADAFTVRHAIAFADGSYRPGSVAGRRLLAHELVHVVQQRAAQPLPGAAPVAVASGAVDRIARRASDVSDPSPEVAPGTSSADRGAGAEPEPGRVGTEPAGGFIVEDDTQVLLRGQQRKTAFLAELRAAVCAAADRELARAGRDTRGCPYIEKWLAHYASRPATHLERVIRKFAAGTASVKSVDDYLPLVAARVAQGVAGWVATGRFPADLPDELRAALPGGAAAGVGGAIAGALSSVAGAGGSALSAIGRLFFKSGAGGAREGSDQAALASRLGAGRPLDGAVRTRMESVFGHRFDQVRIHDDAGAA